MDGARRSAPGRGSSPSAERSLTCRPTTSSSAPAPPAPPSPTGSARPAARSSSSSSAARDWGPFIQMPAALSYPMNMARYDWGFRTEPEPHLGGRTLATPRGKVLGGSSSINGMVYVRGHPRDFDAWADMGADGWAWADVAPYFIRMEDWHGGHSDWRGDSRPAARHPRPAPQPALPLLRRGRRPGRLRAHLRLQRRQAGGLRPDGADGLEGPPLVRRQRLPPPGAEDRPASASSPASRPAS